MTADRGGIGPGALAPVSGALTIPRLLERFWFMFSRVIPFFRFFRRVIALVLVTLITAALGVFPVGSIEAGDIIPLPSTEEHVCAWGIDEAPGAYFADGIITGRTICNFNLDTTGGQQAFDDISALTVGLLPPGDTLQYDIVVNPLSSYGANISAARLTNLNLLAISSAGSQISIQWRGNFNSFGSSYVCMLVGGFTLATHFLAQSVSAAQVAGGSANCEPGGTSSDFKVVMSDTSTPAGVTAFEDPQNGPFDYFGAFLLDHCCEAVQIGVQVDGVALTVADYDTTFFPPSGSVGWDDFVFVATFNDWNINDVFDEMSLSYQWTGNTGWSPVFDIIDTVVINGGADSAITFRVGAVTGRFLSQL